MEGKYIVDVKKVSNDRVSRHLCTSNNYTPQPTTLKIDTRIRDQINTLSLIGYADTQKEVLERAINDILENMDVDEKRKFDVQYQVLEDKTIKTINKKGENKK